MTRILHLIKGLGRGGAEQLLVNMAPHWDASRFEYEVAYLLPWKAGLVGELRAEGIPIHCLKGAWGPAWAGRLVRLVREREIDVVHAHSPYPAILARLAWRGWGGPRLVYTEHNVWGRYRTPTRWGNLVTFARNHHVFAVSEGVRRSVRYPRAMHWVRMPPVETLYHGLDPAAPARWGPVNGLRESLGIPEGAPVVGTVGNLKAHKGHRVLLEAAASVLRSVPEARFVIVGQGPLEDDLKRRAAGLGLGDAVVFAGYREDAPRVCRLFDLFVLSSVSEGLSIALLEAMSLGKPPVVTNVGGLPEVVAHGEQGLVVPPRDPGALADAITTLLGDKDLRMRLGEEAQRRVGDFDIRRAVRRMESVYEELLV